MKLQKKIQSEKHDLDDIITKLKAKTPTSKKNTPITFEKKPSK